jgi:hypothetical protein
MVEQARVHAAGRSPLAIDQTGRFLHAKGHELPW